jgi:hypothetical protein
MAQKELQTEKAIRAQQKELGELIPRETLVKYAKDLAEAVCVCFEGVDGYHDRLDRFIAMIEQIDANRLTPSEC